MKRSMIVMALIAACLTCGLIAGAEELDSFSVVLPLSDSMVLIGSDGVALTEPHAYSSIESISTGDFAPKDELFLALPSYDETQSGFGLLLSSRGEVLTEAIYDDMVHENGLIRYTQNGLSGIMDEELNQIVPCRYTVLVPNGNGGYLALDGDPYDDRPDGAYYIDRSGQETPTGVQVTSGIGEFGDGLTVVTSADSGRVGYLDQSGNWAIAAQFEYGGTFSNGRAEACIESGFGIIDKQGNWLLTPKYTLVSTGFGDGNIILASTDSDAVYMIDPESYQVKQTFEGDEIYFGAYFDRSYVVLYQQDKVSLIDEDGNVLLETDAMGNFDAWYQMGDRVIMREGEWGDERASLMDVATGERIAGPFSELAFIAGDDYGNVCFSFANITAADAPGEEPDDGLGQIVSGGTIDQDGKVMIPEGKFITIENASHGLFIASTKDEVGLIDWMGNWIVKYGIED